VYLYDNSMIETQQFNRSDNFINYKNLWCIQNKV
jgi:hypothetical protein